MSRWVDSVATAVEKLPGTCLEWEPGIFAKSIPACAGGTIHHFYYNGVREGEAPDAHVLRGDLTRPDFVKQNEKQGAYDVILCMQVFEHLSGCPMTAMKNLYTMLKKKGEHDNAFLELNEHSTALHTHWLRYLTLVSSTRVNCARRPV